MCSFRLLVWIAAIAVFLGSPAESKAVPVPHYLEAISTATVFVKTSDTNTNLLAGGSFTAGLSGTVVIDFDTDTVESFSISLAPNIDLTFCGTCSYGGQTETTINTATISSSSPFTGTSNSLIPGGLFTFTGSNADVNGTYSVGASGPTSLSVPPDLINFQVNSLSQIVVTGQQLGILDGSGFGEAENLVISSSLTMLLVPVPEPGSGTLMLLGLAGLGWKRRRRTR